MDLTAAHTTKLHGPAEVPPGSSHALVCLHGFGANGDDLIGLAAPLRSLLPGVNLAVFSPHAPDAVPDEYNQRGASRQWFSDKGWTFRDRPGISRATTLLDAYLTEITTQTGIPRTNIAVMGFSQGAMTALYAIPRLSAPVAGLIGCAGINMWAEDLNPATCHKPLTLLLHGLNDDVVPADQTVTAAASLQNLGFPVDYHLLEDLGHGINAPMLAHIAVFLGNLFKPAEV